MRSLRLLLLSIAVVALASGRAHGETPGTFRVWVFSDAHVGTDKANGRDSLATVIQQSEGTSGFEWDIALDLGDISGAQGLFTFTEGSDQVTVRCYLHTDAFAPQGWYAKSDRVIKLSKPFYRPR